MTAPIPDPILEQAADWLLRLGADTTGDAAERARLGAWRAADPRHEAAWRLAAETWEEAGPADPRTAPVPGCMVHAPLLPARSRRRLAGMALGASLAASLAVAALLPSSRVWYAADHSAATGERREIALSDGSVAVLGAGSALAVDMTAGRRSVTLLRGEAFFTVTPDRDRPFVVSGTGLTVTVTGTAFEVAVGDDASSVAVAEGAVRVAHGAAEEILGPGQSLTVDAADGAPHRRSLAPGDVAAWRQGQLVVGNRPLSAVVDVLRRYHDGFILVTDDALDRRMVTGAFDLGEPERALRALAQPFGAKVRRITPFLLVISPA